ncbi:MAG: hypothetical protein ACLTK9_10440 [Subdoligranulum sp.]
MSAMCCGLGVSFIKLGYRLFAIDSADTASILCFAGVRFMIGAALVWLAGLALNHRPLPMPRGKTLASACGWACGRPRHGISSTTPPSRC